jgi:CHAT domain-containing protein/Tfp pilus assembly protein PilF
MRHIILAIALLIVTSTGFSLVYVVPELAPEGNASDSSGIYNNMGIESFRLGDFERAGTLFQISLEIKKKKFGSLSLDMATTYSNLGVVSRRLNRNDQAMAYYDTAGLIFIDHYGHDHSELGAVYQNQGNILRDKRDVNSALAYYNNALRIFMKNEEPAWVARLYNNIGTAYLAMGEFERAKNYFLMSIEIRRGVDPAGIALPAGNLAISYRETGDMEKADRYHIMALEVISQNWGEDHIYYAINLMNYGLFLVTDAGKPERGYEMLVKAQEIHYSAFGVEGHHIARILMNIGYYYEITGDFQSCLDYQQKSLIANSKLFTSSSYKDNPPADAEVYSLDYMLASLKHKAYSLYLLSAEKEERAGLEASLETYKRAIEFIERIRMGHHTEDSQLLLSDNEHKTYMQAIHVAWKLYELTKEKRFLEEAFRFSERSKAAGLLASIRNVEARSFGGVPEDLLEEEQNLKKGISAYHELIYEEQRKFDIDKNKIALWQEKAFSLELDLRKLIARLEVEYPDYFALKYNHVVSSVKDIAERIGSRDALVSYVDNDSLLYIFTITKHNSEFYRISSASSALQHLEDMLGVLTTGNFDQRVKDDYAVFLKSSRFLYKLLIEPVASAIKNKRLIIIPDGLLSYIPFELLVASDPLPGKHNYKDLQYLLRDFAVSYNYSATLWQASQVEKGGSAGRLLAMAPSYIYSEFETLPADNSSQLNRNKLTPLPGAREEAVRIAGMMKGKVLLDTEATESNFKQMAGDFQLLHLAMHTLLDDANPMFSKLVFTESMDDREDGFLNTYEIYNLRLNASLAILSSCRSGYGTLRRGEGVMSLARGFLYAGVPSIVMTNWEIEDRSGAIIMISFYKYLLKGYRKDEALRKARLDFLENTDMLRAHPYFWGAYVCIGNPDKIFRMHRKYYPYITFGFLAFIMAMILWRGHAVKTSPD